MLAVLMSVLIKTSVDYIRPNVVLSFGKSETGLQRTKNMRIFLKSEVALRWGILTSNASVQGKRDTETNFML